MFGIQGNATDWGGIDINGMTGGFEYYNKGELHMVGEKSRWDKGWLMGYH